MPDWTTFQKNEWKYQSAFVAQLVSAIEFLDWGLLFGFWTIRAALEQLPPKDVPIETPVEAACYWFIYTADALWKYVLENKVIRRATTQGPRYWDRDWKGFNKERWNVWVRDLTRAFRKTQNEDTKKLISEALAEMERVSHVE